MTSSLRFGRAPAAAALAVIACLSTTALAHATPAPLDPQPVDAANLVANADFHSGLQGWTTHVYHANVGGNGAIVHDNGYVGQDIPVTQGATYAFSVQAGANPGGSVLVLALDSGSGVSYITRSVTSPATVTQTFTASGSTVYIACQSSNGPGGWCDHFSLVSAPDAASTGSASTGSAGISSGLGLAGTGSSA
jgi:hypothetical protein